MTKMGILSGLNYGLSCLFRLNLRSANVAAKFTLNLGGQDLHNIVLVNFYYCE